ncbi:DUF5518 domain-containing protein [Halorientalis brevis]|uniref:DUF5518 domain-containing protein n=1 Tax=Halorientalis brevis TaxID=1126241 RepID=A0ABD6CH84_9EURY|nr:DUF5518 domain-containing protein [Halorientalis brevis]
MGEGDTGMNALVGAAVTVLATFTGFAPLLGGAVAGYLNRRDGVKAGALSGVIASIPILVVATFIFGGILAFMPFSGGMMGPGPGFAGAMGIVAVTFGLGSFLLYTVGLGALGGYLGEYLYREDVI